MAKSPEQAGEETPKKETSIAEENREEYKHLFKLSEESDNPTINEFFARRVSEVMKVANEKMDDIHGEANLDNDKIEAFNKESEAKVKAYHEKNKKRDEARRIVQELWSKADELGLEEKRKDIARILIHPDFHPTHTCYVNDRFYYAHKSGIGKKELASEVIRNGMMEYFEHTTHGGNPLAELFEEEGIISKEETKEMKQGSYSTLSSEAIKKLAEKYNINEDELEGLALNLCLAKLSGLRKHENTDGIYDLRSGGGNLYEDGAIENLANTYLKPDLAKAIIERAKDKEEKDIKK